MNVEREATKNPKRFILFTFLCVVLRYATKFRIKCPCVYATKRANERHCCVLAPECVYVWTCTFVWFVFKIWLNSKVRTPNYLNTQFFIKYLDYANLCDVCQLTAHERREHQTKKSQRHTLAQAHGKSGRLPCVPKGMPMMLMMMTATTMMMTMKNILFCSCCRLSLFFPSKFLLPFVTQTNEVKTKNKMEKLVIQVNMRILFAHKLLNWCFSTNCLCIRFHWMFSYVKLRTFRMYKCCVRSTSIM